ncbi:MAG: DNA pilot protein [Microvirus sp.]|nr:MAG: DNA pilot protein [Microvirus sp.]
MGDFISNLGLQTASNIVGTGINQLTAKQQFERQKKLMEIQNQNQQKYMSMQQQNQMELNKQGQEIQLDTWEKTNYPAQMAMIKQAGLNPAMLYAKGGMGGTTGGQGGGSASGGSAGLGSAQMAQGMNPVNVMELKSMMAQIELINAQRKKVEAETPTSGNLGDTSIQGTQAKAEADRASANEANMRAKGIEIANAYSAQEKQTLINKNVEETKRVALENNWTAENWQKNKEMLGAQVTGQLIRNEAEKIGNDLKNAEIEAISVKIAQEAERLIQTGRSLDQKDREIQIQQFKIQIEAQYPGAWDVIGKVMNEAYGTLDYMYKRIDSAMSTNKQYLEFNKMK